MSYGYSPAYAPPAPAYGPPARRSAPPGVHVLAILQYLAGLFTLAVAGLFAWFAVAVANGDFQDAVNSPIPADITDADSAAVVLGVAAGVIAFFGLITIVLGRKLQRGRQWARVIVLMLSILSLVSIAASIALTQQVDVSIASVAYPALCLILLNTSAARSWFRYRSW